MVAKEASKTFWPPESAHNLTYKHGSNTLINNHLKSSLNLPKGIKLQIKKVQGFLLLSKEVLAGRQRKIKTFLPIVKQILAYNYKQPIGVSIYVSLSHK